MRDEIWLRRAAILEPYDGAGMSCSDIAIHTGMNALTVARYAARFGFHFTGKADRQDIADRLRDLALEGKTRKQAAEILGVSYGTVIRYPIDFEHGGKRHGPDARDEAMCAMYKGGKTLEEIGSVYGLTRERVRQVLKKYYGMTGANGGRSVSAERKRKSSKAKKDAACLAKNGCLYSEYASLVRLGKAMKAEGLGACRTPTGAYHSQRRNSISRGIEWNMKLWDWWQVWDASGKWEYRGRGKGQYVMCRFGDTGAYEPGNVYIATADHNVSFQPNNPYRKDHPGHEEAMNAIRHKLRREGKQRHRTTTDGRDLPVGVYGERGRFRAQVSVHGKLMYLGTFDTPEAARGAIDATLSCSFREAAE